MQIKKNSIYILGYKHLFTSLFNEDPTRSKNNIKILSNPSIGLLRFECEVKPYTELTVSYGDSILCDLSPVDPNVGRSSKRARELPSRYEPTLSSKTRKDRNKKRLPSQEVDGVDLTQDSCLANEDSESEATDVFTNSDRQAANYLRKNPAKIVDFIKSFSAEELKEYGLQVKVIDSRKVNSNEEENTSVSSLDNEEDGSVEDSVSQPLSFKLDLFDVTVGECGTQLTATHSDTKERLKDSGMAFLSITCEEMSIAERIWDGLSQEVCDEFKIRDCGDLDGMIKAVHKDVFRGTRNLHVLPMEHVRELDDDGNVTLMKWFINHFQKSIQSYLASIDFNMEVYEGLHIDIS